MSRPGFITRYVSVAKKGFKDLTTRAFELKIRGKIFQGFVVRKADRYYAYENLCQHLPITLDLNDNTFFNHEKTFLQCHMHGAMYEIDTGFCTAGPCPGTTLVSLELREEEGQLVITVPEKFGAK